MVLCSITSESLLVRTKLLELNFAAVSKCGAGQEIEKYWNRLAKPSGPTQIQTRHFVTPRPYNLLANRLPNQGLVFVCRGKSILAKPRSRHGDDWRLSSNGEA